MQCTKKSPKLSEKMAAEGFSALDHLAEFNSSICLFPGYNASAVWNAHCALVPAQNNISQCYCNLVMNSAMQISGMLLQCNGLFVVHSVYSEVCSALSVLGDLMCTAVVHCNGCCALGDLIVNSATACVQSVQCTVLYCTVQWYSAMSSVCNHPSFH